MFGHQEETIMDDYNRDNVDEVNTSYNYTIFVGQGDYETFPSPYQPGTAAPDFPAILLEAGEQVRQVRLSDYWRERDVLIEFGSYT
jgi:hypothetical protein